MYLLIKLIVLLFIGIFPWALMPSLGPFGTLFMLIVISNVIMQHVASRRSQGLETLQILSSSIKNRLPIPEMIELQAESIRGRRRMKLFDFAEMIRDGTPLGVAIEAFYNLVPMKGYIASRVGAETGTLNQSLSRVTERLEEDDQLDRTGEANLIMYLFIVSVWMVGVLLFLSWAVVPRYRQIMQDFDMQSTTFLDYFDTWAFYYFLCGFWIILLILVSGFIAHLLTRFRHPLNVALRNREWSGFKVLGRVLLAPSGTMVDRFLSLWPQRSTPDILWHLSIAAESGVPMGDVVESLSRNMVTPDICKRLGRASGQIHEGQSVWQALYQQRLLSSNSLAMVESAETSEQLPRVLRFLSESLESAQKHRMAIFWETFRTAYLVFLCVVAGLLAVSMFTPLVEMIKFNAIPF